MLRGLLHPDVRLSAQDLLKGRRRLDLLWRRAGWLKVIRTCFFFGLNLLVLFWVKGASMI